MPNWDVSQVTSMKGLFHYALKFNEDIGAWDVSQVTDFERMFQMTKEFQQNINDWDVSKVTNMNWIFTKSNYDQPLDKWDVRNVKKAHEMFIYNTKFSQDITMWDMPLITEGTRRCFDPDSPFMQTHVNCGDPATRDDYPECVGEFPPTYTGRWKNQIDGPPGCFAKKGTDYVCTDEGGSCDCAGDIVYAQKNDAGVKAAVATGAYALISGSDGYACGNDAAGLDPAPGQPKTCWCVPADAFPPPPSLPSPSLPSPSLPSPSASYDLNGLDDVKSACQEQCAAEQHCCNTDYTQGSNQFLSCLQACMIRVTEVSEGDCDAKCDVRTCHYEFDHVTFFACGTCDDQERNAGQSRYKDPGYACSEGFGTSPTTCRDGCAAGSAILAGRPQVNFFK